MSYIDDKIERDASHVYTTPIGRLINVTSVTGVIDSGKSGALVGWAVRETVNYMEDRVVPGADGKVAVEALKEVFASARKESTKIRDTAASVGKEAHDMVEAFAHDASYVPDRERCSPASLKAWGAFKEFISKTKIDIHQAERMVYSKKYKFAGTMDIVATGVFPRFHADKRFLIDVKTGTVTEVTHGPQLAAYAQAWEEMSGEKIDGIAVLQLDKNTGEPKWVNMTSRRGKHFKVFKAALNLHQKLYPKGEKTREKTLSRRTK